MRIFYVNAYFNPRRHEGSRIHIEQLANNLTSMGHEVWVQPASPAVSLRKLSPDRFQRLSQLRKMDVFYFRIEGRAPKMPRYMRSPWRFLGYRAKRVWEINAASDYTVLQDGAQQDPVPKEMDRQLADQAGLVDLAICNTRGLVQFANDLGIRNAVEVPLGTDPDMFRPDVAPAADITRRSGQLNVVWVGSSTIPWHDLKTIADAAWLLRENDKIRFYFIGEYPPDIRFTDNVILKGPRAYSEMPGYLAAMDVGLAIYKEPSWSRYGVFTSPLKLYDYLAAGLVVIASPVEAALKCVRDGETGFLVPFGDAQLLADRLLVISEHRERLADAARRSRALALEYYNWQRVARETSGLLERLLG